MTLVARCDVVRSFNDVSYFAPVSPLDYVALVSCVGDMMSMVQPRAM